MPATSVEGYFEGKPDALAVFRVVADRIAALGPSEITISSQISFGRKRKFAWFWLYNVTKKNPNGVPHIMLALDHPADSNQVRSVTQIGPHRWNHQIVLRSEVDASCPWLGELLELAYAYGDRFSGQRW
jgi:hypothetical protein